ncbi:MAG: GNAT family N-acetyltransferase [Verrucomicrobia bacterium]|nr:GNAT family N-acetyltransferase [Verrucomicrobiota bacterium]MBV8279163.1 GNAT family N-acetyltransferase [Verrucomicrobiota bacterium]
MAATTNVPHPYPREAAIVFIREAIQKAAIREAFVYAILADEDFVGLVSIHRQPLISINFGIAVPFWNKGYATAAVSEAIVYAKNELDARCIESTSLRENIGSKRVMEKNGFKKVSEKLYDGPRMERFQNRILEIYRVDL